MKISKIIYSIFIIAISISSSYLKAQCTSANPTAGTQYGGPFPVTANGVTTSVTYTGVATTLANTPFTSICVSQNSNNVIELTYVPSPSGATVTGTATINFSVPVNNIVIYMSTLETDFTPVETATYTVNNGTLTTTTSTSCNLSKAGNVFTATSINGGDAVVTLSSTSPYTSITISSTSNDRNFGSDYSLCLASITSKTPTLSAASATVCPGNTVNLNSYLTSTPPPGWSTVWYTNNTHTGAQYATPTAATTGTYYAFFTNGTLFSAASSAFTVSNFPAPTITGTTSVCIGSTTQLTGSPTAAAVNPWVSSNTAVATVSSTGLVTGVSAGTATITYTNNNGCSTTATVTVNALPTITGTTSVCVNGTTQLTGSPTAAAVNPWVSSNTAVATVSSTGLVTGVSAGTATITYTNNNGCSITANISVVTTGVVCQCYKPAQTTGTTLDTNHGITALGRAGSSTATATTGAQPDNWPMVRKGAWTALEAKTKGFVLNRLTDAQIAAIPVANLVEGMAVYNITQDCLQIYDGVSWKCYNNQTCSDY